MVNIQWKSGKLLCLGRNVNENRSRRHYPEQDFALILTVATRVADFQLLTKSHQTYRNLRKPRPFFYGWVGGLWKWLPLMGVTTFFMGQNEILIKVVKFKEHGCKKHGRKSIKNGKLLCLGRKVNENRSRRHYPEQNFALILTVTTRVADFQLLTKSHQTYPNF